MAEDEERTEEPTPKRREEAREKGQVARSQDLNKAALLLAGMCLIYFFGSDIRTSMADFMTWAFSHLHDLELSTSEVNRIFLGSVHLTLKMVAPFAIGLMVLALAVSIAQVGFFISFEPLIPDFGKLNPLKGIHNLVSLQAVMRVVMAMLKLTVIGLVTYWAVVNDLPILFGLSSYDVASAFAITGEIVFWMVVKMALAMLALAIIDYLYQHHRHEKQLKMSRQEIKEEFKQQEGDPIVKGRIRRKMLERAFRRMMQSVPKADVVVTNPTHLAVALQYDPDIADAPIVVAKGQRLIAERIKEIAREHNIPIVEDKPLARALFKTVEVGEQIPPALYRAVAKVLGYIYRLQNKKVARKV
jgi:flagellar biosynthetic protein FlhB